MGRIRDEIFDRFWYGEEGERRITKTLREPLVESLGEAAMGNTYSFEEEGEIYFPRHTFIGQQKFGSATVLGRGEDLDYLLYSENEADGLRWILEEGFLYTGQEDNYTGKTSNTEFTTFRSRSGVYNLVLMRKEEDYLKMSKANKLCVKLKLASKADRIAVFDSITGEV